MQQISRETRPSWMPKETQPQNTQFLHKQFFHKLLPAVDCLRFNNVQFRYSLCTMLKTDLTTEL